MHDGAMTETTETRIDYASTLRAALARRAAAEHPGRIEVCAVLEVFALEVAATSDRVVTISRDRDLDEVRVEIVVGRVVLVLRMQRTGYPVRLAYFGRSVQVPNRHQLERALTMVLEVDELVDRIATGPAAGYDEAQRADMLAKASQLREIHGWLVNPEQPVPRP